jgi:hypothetical protein
MKGAHPSRDNLFRRRIRQINADFLQKPFRKRRISIKTKGFGNYADLALPLRRSFVALAFISPIFPNLHMTSPRRLLILVLLGISCCFGCETAPETSAASNSELKQLGTQYMDFFRAQNKAPADESELKEFITATMTDVKREILGITDINKLFISPRDGKPFVVRYEPIKQRRIRSARSRSTIVFRQLAHIASSAIQITSQSSVLFPFFSLFTSFFGVAE